MLVPNPTVEAKVLIGDREADDTTDLSDAASDYGDLETVPSVNAVLVESKTIIGGKNVIDIIPDTNLDETISEDGSTDVRDLIVEKDEVMSKYLESGNVETMNDTLINNTGKFNSYPIFVLLLTCYF